MIQIKFQVCLCHQQLRLYIGFTSSEEKFREEFQLTLSLLGYTLRNKFKVLNILLNLTLKYKPKNYVIFILGFELTFIVWGTLLKLIDFNWCSCIRISILPCPIREDLRGPQGTSRVFLLNLAFSTGSYLTLQFLFFLLLREETFTFISVPVTSVLFSCSMIKVLASFTKKPPAGDQTIWSSFKRLALFF